MIYIIRQLRPLIFNVIVFQLDYKFGKVYKLSRLHNKLYHKHKHQPSLSISLDLNICLVLSSSWYLILQAPSRTPFPSLLQHFRKSTIWQKKKSPTSSDYPTHLSISEYTTTLFAFKSLCRVPLQCNVRIPRAICYMLFVDMKGGNGGLRWVLFLSICTMMALCRSPQYLFIKNANCLSFNNVQFTTKQHVLSTCNSFYCM